MGQAALPTHNLLPAWQYHSLAAHPSSGRLKHKPLTKLGKPSKLSAFYSSTVEVCKWRMSVIRKWIIKVILPCPHTKHITLMVHPVCSTPSNHFHLPLHTTTCNKKIKASRKALKEANGCVPAAPSCNRTKPGQDSGEGGCAKHWGQACVQGRDDQGKQ